MTIPSRLLFSEALETIYKDYTHPANGMFFPRQGIVYRLQRPKKPETATLSPGTIDPRLQRSGSEGWIMGACRNGADPQLQRAGGWLVGTMYQGLFVLLESGELPDRETLAPFNFIGENGGIIPYQKGVETVAGGLNQITVRGGTATIRTITGFESFLLDRSNGNGSIRLSGNVTIEVGSESGKFSFACGGQPPTKVDRWNVFNNVRDHQAVAVTAARTGSGTPMASVLWLEDEQFPLP